MMSRWSTGFRVGRRDVDVLVFTPRRGWPGWCLGLAAESQTAGNERSVKVTLGILQVKVDIVGRG
jgi:hypothetical protein